jgi:threonine synthase
MTQFRRGGTLPASAEEWRAARALFTAHRVDDDETRATIAATLRDAGELIDPHSAVAVAAAKAARRDRRLPMVALACAHPAKFPEAVEGATGVRPTLPPAFADLMERPERLTLLENDVQAVKEFVRVHARAVAGGGVA